MKLVLLIVVLLIIWSIWGYFSSNVEQVEYSVLKKGAEYEIRDYPAHLVAQATVEGSQEEALNKGFQIIARYIFGGNTKKERIAMTAPVQEQKTLSEKIAMTAPVLAGTEGGSRVISFGMPKSYTLDTLPTPNDSRVKLVLVPSKKMAVLRFSSFRSDAHIKKMEKNLLSLLVRDGIQTIGNPYYAGYNGPGTPPWMIRNEILIEIKY